MGVTQYVGCTQPDCDEPHHSRGLCRKHYGAARWLKKPKKPREMKDEVERFFEKVDATGPCWQWTGGVGDNGYGRFRRAPAFPAAPVYAHRFAWEFLVGPIPAGLTLDHLCRNTLCVNPDHLEPVTRAENSRRLGRRIWCASGRHKLTETEYVKPNGDRFCKACARDRVTDRALVAAC